MSEGKIQLVGLSFEELEQWTLGQKQPRFRAKQLYGWLMKGAAFSEMTNLPAAFREVLEREALANPVRIERCVKSKLDGTEKFLYALEDGNLIEGVLMRYPRPGKRWAILCSWAAGSRWIITRLPLNFCVWPWMSVGSISRPGAFP